MQLLKDTPMYQLPTRSWSGAMNMAIDAAMAEFVAERDVGYVRVYGWDPSTLSLGYAQASETIDWTYCEDHDIDVTRRPTGGGAIYHDGIGDIAYSVVLPRDAIPSDLTESYQLLCEPVMAVFDELGLDVSFANAASDALHQPACYLRGLSPAHDLVLQRDGNSRKISGNAQYRTKDAVVQHGSILFSIDVETHLGCLSTTSVTPTSFRERVTSIDEFLTETRAAVTAQLESKLKDVFHTLPGELNENEHARARSLCEGRFGDPQWVQSGPDQEV